MVSGSSQGGGVEEPGKLREALPPSQTLFDDVSSQDIEKQSVEDRQQSETETSALGVLVVDAVDDGDFLPVEPPVEGRGVLSKTLSKVVSRASTKSTPGPPPDGGWLAWSQVIAGHLVVLNSWGYISSFGVFQTYYASTLGRSPSDISWIGSVQIFLLFFIGVLTGRLTDGGYFRQVMLIGIVFQALGLFTTSVATQYWQVFLAQGVCMGLGNGCLFCPSLAVVSTYFRKRRALAIGIMASGTGTGGLVFPSIARQLLPMVGFGWTVRTIGFIQIATLAAVFFVLRPRLPPRRTGPFLELSAFKELEYTFYACASFFCFFGLYFAFFYIASFGRDVIGLSYTEGLNLLLVLNGVGIPGRVLPNIVADRVGPLTMYIPAAGLAGAAMLSWIAVRSAAGLYVWVVFYGLFAGGIQSLFPAGIGSLTPDMSKVGVRLGMIFTIVSFAALTGAPIAGAILAASGGQYHGAQIFAGVSLLVGCAFLVAARVAKARKMEGGWRAKI